MGMFDSLYVKCPKCNNKLEFQSKSGICCLDNYNKSNLTPEVAIGMNGTIVRCQFCNNRIQLVCKIPRKVKLKLKVNGKRTKFDYDGNHNPKHPHSIKSAKELDEIFGRKKRTKKARKK